MCPYGRITELRGDQDLILQSDILLNPLIIRLDRDVIHKTWN